MRIAFYAPLKPPDHPIPSGDRRIAGLFVEALSLAGHDVELASRFRSYDAGDAARQKRVASAGRRLAARWLARNRENPPDMWFTYHLYHKAPDCLGPPVSKALKIPYAVAEASYAPKQQGGPWAAGHSAVAAALAEARAAICLNPDDAPCIRPLLPSGVDPVGLPPFIDTEPARQAAGRRDDLRQRMAEKYSLDPEAPWIAVAAMMRPGDKLASYSILAEALKKLPEANWTLLVAGDGEAVPEVQRLLDFGDKVRFLGTLDRSGLDELHAAADLAAWPAVNEAFGMALLEAQAAGLPVVAGNRPGVAQIVRDGQTGLLTPEGDADAFAAAISKLLGDPGRRAAMRREALAVTAREHDLKPAAQRLGDILEKAIREPVL